MSLLGNLPPLARVTVRCTTCKRFGSYRVARLLERFSRDITDLDLLRALTQSCGHQHEAGSAVAECPVRRRVQFRPSASKRSGFWDF